MYYNITQKLLNYIHQANAHTYACTSYVHISDITMYHNYSTSENTISTVYHEYFMAEMFLSKLYTQIFTNTESHMLSLKSIFEQTHLELSYKKFRDHVKTMKTTNFSASKLSWHTVIKCCLR